MNAGGRMTEAQWQARIIDAAVLHDWHITHFRVSRTAQGWRTPVQGDSGFPDLVLARRGRVIVAELKTDTGRIKPDQQVWLDQLGAHGRLWRPRDWPAVLAELQTAATEVR